MPYHRKLERLYNVNLSDMKPRTWLIEGKIITVPTWKQSGKPYIINRQLNAKYQLPQQPKHKKPSFWKTLFMLPLAILTAGSAPQTQNSDKENLDQSVYYPDDPTQTQEDDMEEDLGLLEEDDDLW